MLKLNRQTDRPTDRPTNKLLLIYPQLLQCTAFTSLFDNSIYDDDCYNSTLSYTLHISSVVVKDLILKDKDKEKDMMSKDEESSFEDKDKDKDLSFEDKYKDNDKDLHRHYYTHGFRQLLFTIKW